MNPDNIEAYTYLYLLANMSL